MTTPPFGRAFDLSSLKKPATQQVPMVGIEATAENLPRDLLPLS